MADLADSIDSSLDSHIENRTGKKCKFQQLPFWLFFFFLQHLARCTTRYFALWRNENFKKPFAGARAELVSRKEPWKKIKSKNQQFSHLKIYCVQNAAPQTMPGETFNPISNPFELFVSIKFLIKLLINHFVTKCAIYFDNIKKIINKAMKFLFALWALWYNNSDSFSHRECSFCFSFFIIIC